MPGTIEENKLDKWFHRYVESIAAYIDGKRSTTISKRSISTRQSVICNRCKLNRKKWPFCGSTGDRHDVCYFYSSYSI